MRILALEPYYGGSHRAVLDGLVESIDAEWTVLTLPPRKWKWRMRGAAITFAQVLHAPSDSAEESLEAPFDLLFASTFVNLAEFRGLVGGPIASVPALVYFHENQLVYPTRHTAEWDYQFPLTNITSALSAEACLFNTRWNLDTFLSGIEPFIDEFPDHHPRGLAELIEAKSRVLSPPFDARAFDAALGEGGAKGAPRGARTRVVWPHRWEHDKDPEAFFSAVTELADEGLDFEVVVAGQAFRETEEIVRSAASHLGDRLLHCEEPASRAEYASLLASCDVAVSTALNEFFGIAMMEAVYAGCYPLVPDRLAYPELYAPEFRYSGHDQLVARLRALILERPMAGEARSLAEGLTLSVLAGEYERAFRETAEANRHL